MWTKVSGSNRKKNQENKNLILHQKEKFEKNQSNRWLHRENIADKITLTGRSKWKDLKSAAEINLTSKLMKNQQKYQEKDINHQNKRHQIINEIKFIYYMAIIEDHR